MKKLLYLPVCIGLLVGCGQEKQGTTTSVKNVESLKLFTMVTSQESGITFNNQIQEQTFLNFLTYEYLYNGSGVSVGDVNGDGLEDIMLISTLGEDELYLNSGNLKFRNGTKESGINGANVGTYGFSTGTTMVDINADGKLDIYNCKSGRLADPNMRRNELYINYGNNKDGVPVFREEAAKYQLDLPHQSTQAAFFDYDRDGDLDMFLINHGTSSAYPFDEIPMLLKTPSAYQSEKLFRNDNGKFVDVTNESGIIDNALSFGLGIAIGDLNNDGWQDVLVGHDYSEKDHLYINQQNGTFKEVILQSAGHMPNSSMGNDIADINNDGLLDFMGLEMISDDNYTNKTSMTSMIPRYFDQLVNDGLGYQYMYNTLQINQGNFGNNKIPVFSDVAQLAGVYGTDWSWGPLFFDMDNDGLKDLFVANGIKRDFINLDYLAYKEKRLTQYQNDFKTTKDPQKLMEDAINDLMVRMPSRFKDNVFFRNNGDLTFKKQNTNWGTNALTSSTGAAYADFDNDGDLDIVTNNVDANVIIYRNNTSELKVGNNFISFQLQGPAQNPDGLGTRVIIETGNKIQIAEQFLTRGFQSSSTRKIHFGVGTAKTIDKATVIWPDGKEEVLTSLAANKNHIVNYQDAKSVHQAELPKPTIFADITSNSRIDYEHKENVFDDFQRESLLPHKMSQFGPALASGDVNGDGLDDFYVGGAMGFPGALYLQNQAGTFQLSQATSSLWGSEKKYEDVAALFFDADADGDQDLYVVSGGNENPAGSEGLQDRLYLNDGKGNLAKSKALPDLRISGGTVKAGDYDGDGDSDLFVGGRQTPGKYPYPASSAILRNDSKKGEPKFTDVTAEILPELKNIGMVTDADWVDTDGDKDLDLVVVGEWMAITVFKNDQSVFKKAEGTGLENHIGWWNTIKSADFDNDGDMDFIAGNLGLNYLYKASEQEPFEVFAKDFDNNGSNDIVLGFYSAGNLVPQRGLECTSNQIPGVLRKFPSNDLFAKATLKDVYGEENLKDALHYAATNFATCYIENTGNFTFKVHPLDNRAQVSSVNTIQIGDFNSDNNLDILIAGNMYSSEIRTPRNDASYGLLLKGDGKGNFVPVDMKESGVCIPGDVKTSAKIKLANGKTGFLFGKNQDKLQLLVVE